MRMERPCKIAVNALSRSARHDRLRPCHVDWRPTRPIRRNDTKRLGTSTNRSWVVEILAPPRPAEFPPEVQPPRGVSIVIVVEDLRTHRADLVGRGGEAGPVVAEDWGTYFGLADPDGVPVYFVERASP
jgi:hypothetical protein